MCQLHGCIGTALACGISQKGLEWIRWRMVDKHVHKHSSSLCLVRLEACSWLWISSCYVEHILWRHSWYVRVNTLSSTMHHRIHQEVRRHSHMCISSCIILGFAYTTYRPIHIFLSFSLCNGKASTWKCISLTQAWPPFHVEARHEAHEKLHFGCWDPAKNEHF